MPVPAGRLAGKVRILLALIALLLAPPGPAQAGKDTLVIGMPTDVPIFDTHKATGLHNGSILNQVSEPLVLLTTNGEVGPVARGVVGAVEGRQELDAHSSARASSSPTARPSTPRR